MGIERHCIDTTFQLIQCLVNVSLLLSQLRQLHLFPILRNLEEEEGVKAVQCNQNLLHCRLKEHDDKLETVYKQLKRNQLFLDLLVNS